MAVTACLALILALLRSAWEGPALSVLPDGWVRALSEWLPGDGSVQLEEGLRARASLRQDDARRALSAAAELLPRSPKALSNYALVLAEQGDFETATRVFGRANAIAPDDPDVQTVRARFVYFTRGPFASLEVLEPLLKRYPGAAEAWSTAGNCYVDLQNTRLAAEAVDRAIRLQPRRAAFYRDSAQIRHQVGALAEAERLAREAVRLAPEDPLSALVLAQVLLDRNASGAALAEARALLTRARRAENTREPALRELGRADALEGRWIEAARLLEEACDLNPADAGARYHLAQAYRRLRDDRYAATLATFRQVEGRQRQERFLRGAVKEQVDAFPPREQLARFYVRIGRREAAATVLRDYAARMPRDARITALARELHLPPVEIQSP